MEQEIKSSVFAKMAKHISNENSTMSYNNINESNMVDSKSILNKIITMLGIDSKEVELGGNANAGGPFYGKLEDGTQVQSDFFDLGHQMMLVKGADLVPAPDADHIVYLPIGLAGSNKRYFITTKGGTITSMNLEDTHGGVKKDVNFAAQTNSEMEKELELGPAASYNETDAVKKEQKDGAKEEMAVDPAQRLDALEAQMKQLRDDIASLFEKQKSDDTTEMGASSVTVSEAEIKGLQEQDSKQGMPNNGGPSKTNMSSAKKFTGAPVEEKLNLGGIIKSNNLGNTMSSVLAKMSAQSRFIK
jgi:BMFP domain-containing protein YqiC